MAYFSTIADVKAVVGGAVNSTLTMATLSPFLAEAGRTVERFTGAALFAQHAATPESEMGKLVAQAVAPLALYEWSLVGNVQVSESGMMRVETETHRATYKYQETEWRTKMLAMGWDGIERLLEYLAMGANDDHDDWVGTPAATRYYELFVCSGRVFADVSGTGMGGYTYDALRSAVEDVEFAAIWCSLPRLGVVRLLEAAYDGTADVDETKAIRLIRKAVCAFVQAEALRRLRVQVVGKDLVVREWSGDQSSVKQSPPTGGDVSFVLNAAVIWANRHMSALKVLLQDVAAFPTMWHPDAGGTNSEDDAWGKTKSEETLAAEATKESLRKIVISL